MADSQHDAATTAAQTVSAQRPPHDDLARVPASTLREVPEAAESHFIWRGEQGEEFGYTARAAHLAVRTDAGALVGQMFSLSYVVDPADHAVVACANLAASSTDPAACVTDPNAAASAAAPAPAAPNPRPVTFCYNGGPGSSSVPVNFGGIGPRRVRASGTGHLAATAPVEDNPCTLLRQSDLVFLDALGTGWSWLAEGVDPKAVWGIDADADCFARAIAAWLTEHDRWGSPVYLYGESYGTVRNAVLMRVLGERGIQVTGVVMLSALFDWVQTLPGEDLYYIGMVPTFAATARHFGRAGKGVDEDAWFDRAMDFAEGEYAAALLHGDRLPARERAAVAKKLAKITGLPQALIDRMNLRVDLDTFRRELLRDEGLVTGRLDTRFTSDAPSSYQGSSAFFEAEDAADDAVEGAYVAAFRSFVGQLGYHGPAIYLANNFEKVGAAWDWSHEEPGVDGGKLPCPNVAHDIATTLRRNDTCKLAILGGRFDAATTYWNVVHDISCQFLSEQARSRVEFHRYGCGHMAYVDEPTLRQMAEDMAAFYAK